MVADTLKDTRDEILVRWIDSVADGYPEETARFLRGQSDRFANPVGASLREGLGEILDGVLHGVEPDDLEPALDRVIRIRAVQDMTPAEAVGFVFELKKLLPDDLGRHGQSSDRPVATDAEIDRVALLAFDVYMRCREQVWKIRNAEVKNLSVGIMERVAEWRARKDSEEGVAPR
jgi:hypothetical protein